jgi:hypothetical protein
MGILKAEAGIFVCKAEYQTTCNLVYLVVVDEKE